MRNEQATSLSDLEADTPVRQRSVLIWLILGYVGLAVALTPIRFWSSTREFTTIPIGLISAYTIALALNVAGGVALFRLQATAIRFFAISTIAAIFEVYFPTTWTVTDLVIPPGEDETTFLLKFRFTYLGAIVFYLVLNTGILFYLMWLRRRGTLR